MNGQDHDISRSRAPVRLLTEEGGTRRVARGREGVARRIGPGARRGRGETRALETRRGGKRWSSATGSGGRRSSARTPAASERTPMSCLGAARANRTPAAASSCASRDATRRRRVGTGARGVSWASWGTTVARGTHQLAGGLALALVRLEFILRELLVALQASQPLHGLRGVIGVARGLHGGSRQ